MPFMASVSSPTPVTFESQLKIIMQKKRRQHKLAINCTGSFPATLDTSVLTTWHLGQGQCYFDQPLTYYSSANYLKKRSCIGKNCAQHITHHVLLNYFHHRSTGPITKTSVSPSPPLSTLCCSQCSRPRRTLPRCLCLGGTMSEYSSLSSPLHDH